MMHLDRSSAIPGVDIILACNLAAMQAAQAWMLGGLFIWSRMSLTAPWLSSAPREAGATNAPPTSFASFRSPGGHASAQVIFKAVPNVRAPLPFDPVRAAFTAWRAAFGLPR
jgi:hypothetical protein